MKTNSFFFTEFFYRNFEVLSYFNRFDSGQIERLLTTIYEAEIELPEAQDEVAEKTLFFKDILLEVPVFAARADELSKKMANYYFRMFYLEHLFIALTISKPDFFTKYVTVTGFEKVEKIYAEEGSCIFSLYHIGPHLIAPFIMSKLGCKISGGGGVTDDYLAGCMAIEKLHSIPHCDVIQFTDNFKDKCVEYLTQGRGITLYPEYSRSQRKGHLTTDFLGTNVHVPTGIGRLAMSFKQKIVSVAFIPNGNFKYELRFGEVFAPENSDEIDQCMLKVFKNLEEIIKVRPEIWEGWQWYELMIDSGKELQIKKMFE